MFKAGDEVGHADIAYVRGTVISVGSEHCLVKWKHIHSPIEMHLSALRLINPRLTKEQLESLREDV